MAHQVEFGNRRKPWQFGIAHVMTFTLAVGIAFALVRYMGWISTPFVVVIALTVVFPLTIQFLGVRWSDRMAAVLLAVPCGRQALRYWRPIARTLGVLLIICSACTAYFWFHKIAPLRHVSDPEWLRQHSETAYWNEVKAGIRRSTRLHDSGWAAGCYGDKELMAQVMPRIAPGDDISSCAVGHMDTAFRNITNQDVGEASVAWLDWWKDNKSESQLDWIRDGFAQYDVAVSIPPSPSDTIPLLKLLGGESQSGQVPDFVKYNAFRWLRDSEFNPVEFVLANDATSLGSTTREGVLEYLERERSWPIKDRVGYLEFANAADPYSSALLPAILTPKYQAVFYALIIWPLCLGCGLIVWTFRIGKPRQISGRVKF